MRNKTTNFKPILITVNAEAENEFNLRKTAFLTILEDFWQEAVKFIDLDNKSAYRTNFFNEFKSQFEQKYSKDFPSILSTEKIMELVDVNVNKLRFLSDKLNDFSDIQIHLNTNEIETPDFGIYTSSIEQNKLLEFLFRLSSTIHEAENFTSLNKGMLLNGFNRILDFDHSTQKFVPNYYFITNQIR
jgi:hypothetical protein